MTSQTFSIDGDGGRLSRRTWAIALGVAVAACLLRVLFANQRGFWLDEYFTLNAAKMSISDMIENRLGAGHSPLYFFYARLGLLLGNDERALRLTSAVAAAGLVLALTGLLGELRLGRGLPLLWVLAVFEPYWIGIGMEYRYTMPLLAVAAGTAWLAARFASHPDGRRGAGLALAIGVLLWTHGSAPFFVIGLLAFLVWEGLGERPAAGRAMKEAAGRILRRVWPVAAGVAAGVPFYVLVRNHKSETEDQVAHFGEILKDLVDVVFGEHRLWINFFDLKRHSWLFNLETAVLAGAIWLTWRELRRQGNGRAWRLLASTLVAIPLLMFGFCVFVKNFQGPVRYLATFSIPAVICLAVAGQATFNRRWLAWAYRGGLLTVLLIQSSAMALDRGDRHRDAIMWLIRNHPPESKDPILMSVTSMNNLALEFKGFKTRGITEGGFDRQDSLETVQNKIRKDFATARRGLYIRYHSRAKVLEGIDLLTEKGFFVGHRRWKVGGRLVVGAVIRDKREQAWLDGLEEPEKEWGPAQVD